MTPLFFQSLGFLRVDRLFPPHNVEVNGVSSPTMMLQGPADLLHPRLMAAFLQTQLVQAGGGVCIPGAESNTAVAHGLTGCHVCRLNAMYVLRPGACYIAHCRTYFLSWHLPYFCVFCDFLNSLSLPCLATILCVATCHWLSQSLCTVCQLLGTTGLAADPGGGQGLERQLLNLAVSRVPN